MGSQPNQNPRRRLKQNHKISTLLDTIITITDIIHNTTDKDIVDIIMDMDTIMDTIITAIITDMDILIIIATISIVTSDMCVNTKCLWNNDRLLSSPRLLHMRHCRACVNCCP